MTKDNVLFDQSGSGARAVRAGALLLGMIMLAAPLALAQGEDQGEEEEDFGPIGLYLDEDDAVTGLLGRAERAAAEKNIRAAVEDYSRILDRYPEKVVRVNDDLYRPVSEVATEKIIALGSQGLQIYRLLIDSQAEALYRRSLASGNATGLVRIIDRSFASSWGDDACYALGRMRYDEGGYREAVDLWRRIVERHPDPSMPRETLYARMASASARIGDEAAARAAAKHLGDTGISLAGSKVGAKEFLKLRLATMPKGVVTAGGPWSTYGGGADHTGAVPDLKPVSVLKWLKSIPSPPAVTNPGYRPNPRTKNIPKLSTQIVSDGKLGFLVQSHSVHAHRLSTFAEIWRYKLDEQRNTRRGYYPYYGQAHRPRFCSLHRGRVYATLGAVAPPAIRSFGRMPQTKNTIVCLGAQSGKLIWDSSKVSTGEAKEFIDDTYFATSPTVTDEGVFAIGLASGSLRDRYMVCLDPETGVLRWKTFICSGTSPRLNSSGIAADHGLPVTVADGFVYAATNLGAIACFNAETGALRWLRTYKRLGSDKVTTRGFNPYQSNVKWLWYPTPPIAYGGMIICAPQDSHALMAIDTMSGKERWRLRAGEADRRGLRYVLGISAGKLVLSGSSTIALKATTGKVDWISPVAAVGRGALTDTEAIIPGEPGLRRIRLNGGKLAGGTIRWSDGAKEKGHLFAIGSIVIAAGENQIASYVDESGLMQQLLAAAAKGDSPVAHFEIAAVHYRKARYDKAVEYYKTSLKMSQPGKVYDGLKAHEESTAELYRTFVAWANSLRKAGKTPDAVSRFRNAHDYATKDRQRIELMVAVASTLEDGGDLKGSVAEYQRIIAECPDSPYEFESGRVTKGCIGAEIRIAKLIEKHGREVYARFDAAAKKLYDAGFAASDEEKLKELLERYPNSNVLSPTLMKLADIKRTAGDARGAARTLREHLRRFGPPYKGDEGNRTAQVLTELADCYLAARMYGPARSALRRLTEEHAKAMVKCRGKELAAAELAKLLRKDLPGGARLAGGLPSLKIPLRSPTNEELGLGNVVGGPIQIVGTRPASAANIVHLTDYRGSMEAREGKTGKVVWKRRLGSRPMATIFSDDNLIALTQNGVFALHAGNGKEMWRKAYQRKVVKVRGRNIQSYPWRAIAGEGVVGVLTQAGQVDLLDAAGGELVWSRELNAQLYYTCAIADDAMIVISSNPRKVYAFDLHSGAVRFEVDMGKTFFANVGHIVGGVLVLGGSNKLQGYDMRTGQRLWQKTLQGSIRGQSLQPHAGNIVVVTNNGVECYAPSDGKRLWKSGALGGYPRRIDISGDIVAVSIYNNNKNSVILLDLAAKGKKLFTVGTLGPMGSVTRTMPTKEHLFFLGTGYVQAMIPGQGRHIYRSHRLTQLSALDRASGKIVWSRMFDGYYNTAQLVDGALWVGDHRTSRAFVPVDVQALRRSRDALKRDVQRAPDVAKLMRLARIHADLGEFDEAVGAAARATDVTAGAGGATFTGANALLGSLRFERGLGSRPTTTIASVEGRNIKIDGRLDDWPTVKAEKLDSRRHAQIIFTPGQSPDPKAWSNAKDCSAKVRTGWSAAGLHVAVEVTDDRHRNPETTGTLFSGDSVVVSVDLDPRGGYRYSPNDLEFGFALNSKNRKKMAVKWTPLRRNQQTDTKCKYAVRRDEKARLTTYEILITPASLGGFSFRRGAKLGLSISVNDADDSKTKVALTAEPTLDGARVPASFKRCKLGK